MQASVLNDTFLREAMPLGSRQAVVEKVRGAKNSYRSGAGAVGVSLPKPPASASCRPALSRPSVNQPEIPPNSWHASARLP
jgi:hypothetical protein